MIPQGHGEDDESKEDEPDSGFVLQDRFRSSGVERSHLGQLDPQVNKEGHDPYTSEEEQTGKKAKKILLGGSQGGDDADQDHDVVAFSFSRYSAQPVQIAEDAQDIGCQTNRIQGNEGVDDVPQEVDKEQNQERTRRYSQTCAKGQKVGQHRSESNEFR